MKHPGIEPKVHEAPSPGPHCPFCGSKNTAFVSPWVCFDCCEEFSIHQRYTRPSLEPRIIEADELSHTYLSYTPTVFRSTKIGQGFMFTLTKEQLKRQERFHTNPGPLNPDVNLLELIDTLKKANFEEYMKNLTPEELEALKARYLR